MATPRHLANAPIAEALIDFRVRPAQDSDTGELLLLKDSIAADYPEMKTRRFFEAAIGFETDGQPEVRVPRHEVDGYLFYSTDRTRVVQFRKDGFTFSCLRPYTRWEDLLASARELWPVYLSRARAESVERVAVRYINHIGIPSGSDLEDYLVAPPALPEGLHCAIGKFVSRLGLHDVQRDLDASLTQALEPAVQEGSVRLLLDIDAFKLGKWEPTSEAIWTIIGQLRHLKNDIFFESITEKTAGLFE